MRLEPVRRLDDPHELLTQPRLAAVIEPAPAGERRLKLPLARVDAAAEVLIERHGRLIGLFRIDYPEPSLLVAIAFRGELIGLRAPLDGAVEFPSLARFCPAASCMTATGSSPSAIPTSSPSFAPTPTGSRGGR
jgi:hypothetical protein